MSPEVDAGATKAKGSRIDIRHAPTGGLIVTIDMCVTHRCADMAEVIAFLNTLQPPGMSAARRAGADGGSGSEPESG